MVRFRDIKHIKTVHPVYEDWLIVKDLMTIHHDIPFIGKDWHLYYWKGIRVSLIILPKYLAFKPGEEAPDVWEYCGGGMTRDVVRAVNRRSAEREIFQLFKWAEKRMSQGKSISNPKAWENRLNDRLQSEAKGSGTASDSGQWTAPTVEGEGSISSVVETPQLPMGED